MLPGVIVDERIHLPKLERDSPVCISIYSESRGIIKGPVAVGRCLMSSDEMISSNMKGKGVHILHYYQDELWNFGTRETVPIIDASKILTPSNSEQELQQSKTMGAIEVPEILSDTVAELNITEQDEVVELPPEEDNKTEQLEENESQEEFLRKAFLYALRYQLPEDIKFPLDVGQFYASYLLKSLPEGRKIDMKKTKYKKFSTFLQEVNQTAGDGEWFVKVLSKKGIDSIVDINLQHPEVQNAAPLDSSNSSGF
uniref:Uncharacterized protein n=1 Tax=Panagrolaimus davidi TaxID=227884 RepID=A0A914PE94_9BILA